MELHESEVQSPSLLRFTGAPETTQEIPETDEDLDEEVPCKTVEDLEAHFVDVEIKTKSLDTSRSSGQKKSHPNQDPSNVDPIQKERPWAPFFSHARRAEILKTIVDDAQNHLTLSFEEIHSLIKALRGKIFQEGTFHCGIELPHAITGKGVIGYSARPYGRHQGKLRSVVVKNFQSVLSRAGMTPETLLG